MKTLIDISTKESKHVWSDDVNVVVEDTCTTSPYLIIGDMNITNAVLVENITLPTDWLGGKYLYDNNTWTLNPKWIEPVPADPIPEPPTA